MYLGIDIGGTHIKYAFFDRNMERSNIGRYDTPKSSFDALISIIEEIYSLETDIEGVGISCPGTIHHEQQKVLLGGALPYLHNQDLKAVLEEKLGVPVCVENDGKAAALGEMEFGSLKGCQEAMVMVLGSGVGGGFIFNGKLRYGYNYNAGEISYMCDEGVLDMKNYHNMVGYKGSAVTMVNKIAKALGIEPKGETVFEYIYAGNEIAVKEFESYCDYIADKIVNINYLLDVEKVIVTGGITQQPITVETIRKYVEAKIPPFILSRPKLVNGELGSLANIYGAIAPLLKQ